MPVAKCVSNADVAYDDIHRKNMRDGLTTLIEILDEMNGAYMDDLAKPCGFFDFACKKDRKKTKVGH